jgi:branched-chain amino acid transport system substrate-binding protein
MKLRRIIILCCVVAAAVAVTACGSSSKKKTGTTSTPVVTSTSTPTSTAKGTPIPVGSICSCSGAQAAVFQDDDKVMTAWADAVNAAGGVNGHPVKMTVLDDGGNPSTSLQDAKKLVEQDHVVAIVGDMSLADQAWASYITAKGIPVLGGISDEAPFLTNPNFYPSGTQLIVSTVGVALQAKAAGGKHFGVVYCAESPICAQLDPLAKGAAALAGMKYTSAKIAATAPSYASPCLAFKGAGVDALYVAENTPVVIRFVDQCAQQGYKPINAINGAELSNLALGAKNLEGTVLAQGQANAFDTSTPAVATFQSDLQKYAPGIVGTSKFAAPMMLAWSGGKLFEAAGKAGDVSTAAGVKKALYSLKNETLEGLAPPLNFTPGKPAFITCYFAQKISGGKFASLNGNKPLCLTATQATALAASLKH